MSSSTTAAARSLVYSSYRRLYRARVALFRGDDVAMRESRVEVRNQYLSHGTLPIVDASHWQGLIDMADEAASMLRHSIVQSKLNETTGHYEAKLKAEHVDFNTGASGQPPLVEPITATVVQDMENSGKSPNISVERVKGCGSSTSHR